MRKAIDEQGKRYGKLVVIERKGNLSYGKTSKPAAWLCMCDCGNKVIVTGCNLRRGHKKSCGCDTPNPTGFIEVDIIRIRTRRSHGEILKDIAKDYKCSPALISAIARGKRYAQFSGPITNQKEKVAFKDETNNVYGRLVVLRQAPHYISPGGDALVQWLCQCKCGKTTIVAGSVLRARQTISCGCYAQECRIDTGHKIYKKSLERIENGDHSWYIHPSGYVQAKSKHHPLANNSGVIFEHWYIFWEYYNRAEWTVKARKNGATLHHKNGIKTDNRIENLELRLRGNHPQGIGVQDMIDVLSALGYKVEK